MAEAERGDAAASIALAERAVALDPAFAAPYLLKSQQLAYTGNLEGALTALEDCIARVPTARTCLEYQNLIDEQGGNCQRIELTSQQLLARDPSDNSPYYFLATAGYALGRPREAVAELFRQRVARLPAALRPRFELWHFWALDVLAGDLDTARGRALDLEQSATANADKHLHARATVWWNAASIESGRPQDAKTATLAYMRRDAAWATEPRADDWTLSRDPTPALLRVERDLGLLTPDEFERQRGAWVDAWNEKVPGNEEPFVWLHGYAAVAETADDARESLAAQPRFGQPPRFTPWALGDAYIGTTYFLAGRMPEALPFLRRAARSCLATEFPFEQTQVHLVLGQALEATGERDEACAAYGVVLGRWGRAKPRSITAEKARALARGLGCRIAPPVGAEPVFE
jgi:serine/threonine-protein kinase